MEVAEKNMTKLTVLFVSQIFPPDISAGAFRISETADQLSHLGFQVTVLTARPHRYQAMYPRESESESDVRVIRAPVLSIGDRGGFWYLIQFVFFMVTALFWGIAHAPRRVDYVIASSPPLPVGIPGWLLAKLKRARFVLDVRDLWPDSAVATEQLPLQPLSLPLGRWLEQFLYRRAELITCVSRMMAHEITKRVKGKRPIEVIYNGVDLSIIEKMSDYSTDSNQKAFHTLAYGGNLGRSQELEVLVKAAKHFPNLRFKLIGDGVKRRTLENLAEELDNVEFLGPYTKKHAMQAMSEASALFLHLRNSEVFATTIPSKLFDYLQLNLPILYGISGEGADLLANLPGNIPFEASNVESLIAALKQLQEDYPNYLQQAQQNRDILEKFTREEMARRLAERLKALSER